MRHFKLNVILLSLLIAVILGIIGGAIYAPRCISRLSDREITSVIKLLGEHNISIDREIIPRYTGRMRRISVSNYIADPGEFAALLMGQGAAKAGQTAYTKDGSRLTLNGNRFSFIPAAAGNAGRETDSGGNAGRRMKRILEQLGFDLSGTLIHTIDAEGQKTEGTVTRKHGVYPIFNDSFQISLSEGGIRSISGIWFYEIIGEDGYVMPKTAAGALAEFALKDGSAGAQIREIELGYRIMIDENIYERKAQAQPVWRIITSDMQEYFVQA